MKNPVNKQSIYQIMLKKSLLAGVALSSVLLLSACNGSSQTTVADNNANLNSGIVVEKAATIPALDGRATAAGIYIRNTTGKTISGISYGLAQTNSPTSLTIDSASCNTIAANSSCLLPLTTPALTSGISGSNIVVATYNGQQSKQLINYRYIATQNYNGVNFSDNSQSLFGTDDYATVYVFVGKNHSQNNVGFNPSNNSLAVVSGLTNGKVDIPADTVIPLEIQSNHNVTSTQVTLTPYTVTTSKRLQKALMAGIENNTTLTVTITPTQQANLLMSDLPLLTPATPTANLTIVNNGNQSATISGLTAGSANVSVAAAATNPCDSTPLDVGASCNYTISKNNNDSNGSAILTLAYNNSVTATTATQTVYYQNSNTAPMVAAGATQTNFSEQVGTTNNITFNLSNSSNVPLNNAVITAKTTLQNTTLTILNNTCSSTIAANGSCSLQVSVPASASIDSGVIYLNITGDYTNATTTDYSFMSKPVYATIIDTTNPTVTSTTPQNTTLDVSTATGIVVNFSEPMTATTLNNGNIVLRKVGDASSIPLTLQGVTNNNQTVTFTKTNGVLVNNTQYEIVIHPFHITDANGNAMSSATSQVIAIFTTAQDSTAPTISNVTPANGATNQSQTPAITLTFSEAMQESMLTNSNIILQTQAGTVVTGTTISYDPVTYVATVNLNGTQLSSQTTYQLLVNQNNLKDLAGNAMGSSSSYQVSQFTVGDYTAPTLSSTVPINGATNIAVATPISLTFSEVMDTTTLVDPNIKLLDSSSNPVALGTPAYSNNNQTVTFTPTTALTGEASYSIVINPSAIKDAAGNAMDSSTSQTVSSFTVQATDLLYYSTGQGIVYGNNTPLAGSQFMYGVNGYTISYLGIDTVLDQLYVLADNHVYKYSTDENKYILIGNGTLPGYASKIVVNSSNKNIYALIRLNNLYYVYVSAGGTGDWTVVGGGNAPVVISGTMYIGVDSGNGNVYINCGCGYQMYKSAGGTGNWTSIGTPSAGSYGFVVDSNNHNIYVSGSTVKKLAGGTGSWTSMGSPPTVNISYSLALDAAGNLYSTAYTGGKTYTAKYSSGTWSTIGTAVTGDSLYPQGLSVNSTGAFVPIGDYSNGYSTYLSSGGTGSWSNLNHLSSSVISSPTSSSLYSINRNYLNTSKYNGSTWQDIGVYGAINSGQVTSLFGDENNLYASTNERSSYGIYRRSGSSWSAVALSNVPDGAGINQALLHSDNCIYAGTGYPGGDVYKLCGSTWTLIGGGSMPDASADVENIAINGNKIYAASNCSYCYDPDTYDNLPSHVYVSNNGAAWAQVGGAAVPNSTYYAVLVATDIGNSNVYACVTSSSYCYKSTSGTANWSALPTIPGSLSDSEVRNIMYVNSTNHYLYVGSSDGNVYVYNGASWAIVGGGKPDNNAITAVRLMANGDVYAATALGNIYKSDLGTGNWVKNGYGKYGFPIFTIFAK